MTCGTGREVVFRAADFHRVVDGRIVRTWHLEDYFEIARQIGLELKGDGDKRGLARGMSHSMAPSEPPGRLKRATVATVSETPRLSNTPTM